MKQPLHIIVLAAGEGKRMQSPKPKVLQPLAGRPMLQHIVETATQLDPEQIHVVYGSGGDQVLPLLNQWQVNPVHQAQRLGTGHAVKSALPELPEDALALILLGDHPLISPAVLKKLLSAPAEQLTVLTIDLPDPGGYGRIVRDTQQNVLAVVEDRDADAAQRLISEVNTGIMAAPVTALRRWLEQLKNDNAQGEYYLTDIFALARAEGTTITAVKAADYDELAGANDKVQLAALERTMQKRIAQELMRAGVSLMDPARIDVRGDLRVGQDVSIDVNCVFEGVNRLGDGVVIGPGCVLSDCDLAPGTQVKAYSVLEQVVTEGACEIGPFARLRPGTRLSAGVKIGNFVEVKNSTMGQGSKASHLSYLGDATIGSGVNIGAGTITCNYDGANKHQTIIGDNVFVGSNTQIVAPISVGDGATIGAGSTITKDVAADTLAVSRGRQVQRRGWRRPKKKQPE